MPEPTALYALMKRAAARAIRRRPAAPQSVQHAEAVRVMQSMLGPTWHKVLVKQRNRAANRVARRSRRVNRMRAS